MSNKEKLIELIQDLNQDMQSIIGMDEEIQNDYADGYQQAVEDIISLIKELDV